MSGRDDSLRDGIRAREGKCVMYGVVNIGSSLAAWSGRRIFSRFRVKVIEMKLILVGGLLLWIDDWSF